MNNDQWAVDARNDEDIRSQLICQHERYILWTASRASRRFVRKDDDEWSVALLAFSQAIDTFDPDRGSFLPHAALVIRRRLSDHYRSQRRYEAELPVPPHVLEGEWTEEEHSPLYERVATLAVVREDRTLADEIAEASEAFTAYGFSFYDLAACSPKSGKTKLQCAQAIRTLLADDALVREMKAARQLPIAKLQKSTGLPRKTLERYRRYIIAACEIETLDCPGLSGYLGFLRKEGPR